MIPDRRPSALVDTDVVIGFFVGRCAKKLLEDL